MQYLQADIKKACDVFIASLVQIYKLFLCDNLEHCR